MERLAVLPLIDFTDDPEQEYLAAGVHEALIAELGQLGLSVTARRTMARYRETDLGIGEIARELGVDGVIEGSVFRGGDSLEITAGSTTGTSGSSGPGPSMACFPTSWPSTGASPARSPTRSA
jgi:adenylate cyclase